MQCGSIVADQVKTAMNEEKMITSVNDFFQEKIPDVTLLKEFREKKSWLQLSGRLLPINLFLQQFTTNVVTYDFSAHKP